MRNFSRLCGCAVWLAVPIAAIGQTGSSDDMLQEIVVTASKRAEPLQTTPVAITAFTAADLQRSGAFDAVDLGTQTPGLSAAHTSAFGSPVFFVRGIGTDSFSIGSDQDVGVYLDGVYVGRNVASVVSFLDLDRVEILKGPQGTLYGRNTTAGAINYITRQPSDEFRAEFTLTAGNYGDKEASGVVSGPLIPGTLQAKFGFKHSARDGYIHDIVSGSSGDDRNSDAAFAQLRYTPSSSVTLLASLDWAHDKSNGTYYSNITPVFNPFGLLPEPVAFAAFSPQARSASVDCNAASGCQEHRDVLGGSLRVDWQHSDEVSLNSLTAYRQYNYFIFSDQDATDQPLDLLYGHENQSQVSQEFQLAAKSPRWDNIFGLYYFSERDAWPDVYFGVPPFNFDIIAANRTHSYAAYADVRYHASERLTLAAGWRYSRDRKDLTFGCQDNIGFSVFTCPPSAGRVLGLKNSAAWAATTPQATVEYQWTSDAMTYVKWSKGFKSGAFNTAATELPQPVDPERLSAYEVGAKTAWFDRRLIADLAVYYYDFSGLQIETVDPNTGQAITVAAGRARVQGLELETRAQPFRGLELTLGTSYIDSRFTDFVTLAGDYTGHSLPRAPRWTIDASAQYRLPLSDTWTGFLYTNFSRQGSVFFSSANDPRAMQPAYDLVTARAGIQSKAWTVSLGANNLTDKAYWTTVTCRSDLGNCFGIPAPPRMWSLELIRRFGAE